MSLTGLAASLPDDPEPEFVDINQANQAVVTLQENNHIVVVDLPTRQVVSHFPAGAVNLTGVDRSERTPVFPIPIALTDTQTSLREPDAVAWVGDRIATANEGDLDGGSRGFSIFNPDGSVVFDSGNTLEHLAVRFGHYPERRSDGKGTEPEAIAAARFGPNDLLFVGSERGSFVAVSTGSTGTAGRNSHSCCRHRSDRKGCCRSRTATCWWHRARPRPIRPARSACVPR